MKNLAGTNYKIKERKSSKFGAVGYVDKQSSLEKPWVAKPFAYYTDMARKDAYISCLDRYNYDQLARPIINMITHAIFSKPPDFQGDDKLVKRAQEIVRDSEINWNEWGADLEVFGDLFLRVFLGKEAKIASIPPGSIDIEYDQKNILDISSYTQFKDEKGTGDFISPEEMVHVAINKTTSQVYGSGTLRPVLWWLDVLDNLWERNWIRAAQYYGAPITVFTGIPGDQIEAIKTALELKPQQPGRNLLFPPDVKADTLDFTKNYPIEVLVDRVYQYILAAVNIPQHLIYESDSSRGVAMFSADGFEMMIKARRNIWELGLVKAMRLIFKDEGIWKQESKFKVSWAPVFMRDLKNVASFVDSGIQNGIMSKQAAREFIGIDHSEEKERIKTEKAEEPNEMVQTTGPDGKTTTVSGKIPPTANPKGKK